METIFIIFGGIGVFILGLTLMSDGLKALAGDSLKRILSKFTGGILSSIGSGTLVTAIIQSSSATILMVIGFVSAGLLTFSQSIGVVIGANLGSSTIGWIVAAVGLKVKMSMLAMPVIGLGAFLAFFSKEKYSAHGMALAGFGLLFLGIDILQNGMSVVTDYFNFDSLGDPTFLQTLGLLLIGIVMTVLMQSSSAAMVITLTALAADALVFEQAAALVIGQNVGTTVKAYVATIGGTAQTKRTAMAHILFNLVAALMVLVFLPFIISFVFAIGDMLHINDTTISLALFGTLFYLIGVVVVVPFLSYFKKIIEYIIPERHDALTKYLDPSVAAVAPVAIEAVRRTLVKVMIEVAAVGTELYTKEQVTRTMSEQLKTVNHALEETTQFLSKINVHSSSTTQAVYLRQVGLVHAIDHLLRLVKALEEAVFTKSSGSDERVRDLTGRMNLLFLNLERSLQDDNMESFVKELETNSAEIAEIRRQDRKSTFEITATQQVDASKAIQQVHTLHWFDKVAYHLWRGVYHLDESDL